MKHLALPQSKAGQFSQGKVKYKINVQKNVLQNGYFHNMKTQEKSQLSNCRRRVPVKIPKPLLEITEITHQSEVLQSTTLFQKLKDKIINKSLKKSWNLSSPEAAVTKTICKQKFKMRSQVKVTSPKPLRIVQFISNGNSDETGFYKSSKLKKLAPLLPYQKSPINNVPYIEKNLEKCKECQIYNQSTLLESYLNNYSLKKVENPVSPPFCLHKRTSANTKINRTVCYSSENNEFNNNIKLSTTLRSPSSYKKKVKMKANVSESSSAQSCVEKPAVISSTTKNVSSTQAYFKLPIRNHILGKTNLSSIQYHVEDFKPKVSNTQRACITSELENGCSESYPQEFNEISNSINTSEQVISQKSKKKIESKEVHTQSLLQRPSMVCIPKSIIEYFLEQNPYISKDKGKSEDVCPQPKRSSLSSFSYTPIESSLSEENHESSIQELAKTVDSKVGVHSCQDNIKFSSERKETNSQFYPREFNQDPSNRETFELILQKSDCLSESKDTSLCPLLQRLPVVCQSESKTKKFEQQKHNTFRNKDDLNNILSHAICKKDKKDKLGKSTNTSEVLLQNIFSKNPSNKITRHKKDKRSEHNETSLISVKTKATSSSHCLLEDSLKLHSSKQNILGFPERHQIKVSSLPAEGSTENPDYGCDVSVPHTSSMNCGSDPPIISSNKKEKREASSNMETSDRSELKNLIMNKSCDNRRFSSNFRTCRNGNLTAVDGLSKYPYLRYESLREMRNRHKKEMRAAITYLQRVKRRISMENKRAAIRRRLYNRHKSSALRKLYNS